MGRQEVNDGSYIRWFVLMRSNGHCQACGAAVNESSCEAHHINPIVYGGKTSLDNMVCLCKGCHTQETIALFRSIKLDREFERMHRQIILESLSGAYLPAISKMAFRILTHETRMMVQDAHDVAGRYQHHNQVVLDFGKPGLTDDEWITWVNEQTELHMAGQPCEISFVPMDAEWNYTVTERNIFEMPPKNTDRSPELRELVDDEPVARAECPAQTSELDDARAKLASMDARILVLETSVVKLVEVINKMISHMGSKQT